MADYESNSREKAEAQRYNTRIRFCRLCGADLYACPDVPVEIAPGKTPFIPTGLTMEIHAGYAGLAYARSGLACKQDLAPGK